MTAAQLDLFGADEQDEMTATISPGGYGWFNKSRVSRAWLTLPSGRAAHEDAANRYSVQLIPGGPYMASTQSCQNGRYSPCQTNDCGKCPDRVTKYRHLTSAPQPEAYIEHRDHRGHWRIIEDPGARLLPIHLWRCSCTCHEDLFEGIR